MFDPSIFENLKVVLEGKWYDLDLANEITITARKDLVDLASMSRTFTTQFQLLPKDTSPIGEMTIHASLQDFAIEKMENTLHTIGCELFVTFFTSIQTEEDCNEILNDLQSKWNFRPNITQKISYTPGKRDNLSVAIQLSFGRKINEDHLDDLEAIIQLTVESLYYLQQRIIPF